jgi:transposase
MAFWDRKLRKARDFPCGELLIQLLFEHRRIKCNCCGAKGYERLSWLSENPFYTQRFAMYIGRMCEEQTITAVGNEHRIDWKTVKELEKEYMRLKLEHSPAQAPEVIGIDEISVHKGQNYRIVVSDLRLGRPIWFGGKDRTEESMDLFYQELGAEKCRGIRLVVMDMWKAFEKSAQKNVPQAAILYDKFHVINHLNDALDTVRRSEYHRLSGKRRSYIKGQRYNLLTHKENLELEGRRALNMLFQQNKRLYKAYLLKESFDQLWDYTYPASALKFFQNWKSALKWQRLPAFEKFARLIERHWEGIVAYCNPEYKDVPLGFVEGLNNKIRVIQRRAYGLRDEEYLRLKVLTCMLPPLKIA